MDIPIFYKYRTELMLMYHLQIFLLLYLIINEVKFNTLLNSIRPFLLSEVNFINKLSPTMLLHNVWSVCGNTRDVDGFYHIGLVPIFVQPILYFVLFPMEFFLNSSTCFLIYLLSLIFY